MKLYPLSGTPIAVLLILCAHPTLAQTVKAPCVLLSKAPSIVVHQGKDWQPPVRFDDCSDVLIKDGNVSVCFVTPSGQRTCRALGPGDSVRKYTESIADRADSLGSAVLAMLRGDAETRAGQTRSPTGTLGYPYGAILGLGNVIEVRTADPQTTVFELFDVTNMDKPIYTSSAGQPIHIPAAKLDTRTSYRWRARTPTASYSGAFLMAGPESEGTRRKAQALLADKALSASERDYLLADLLDQDGFLFERDLLVERMIVGSEETSR